MNINDGAKKVEMTIDEIKALPNMLGFIASAKCMADGEYKCTIGDVKTWIVLKK